MIIAFLFNWTPYPQNRNYWHDIRRAVFKTGVIQRSGRHMKLSVGDVLCGIERGQNPEALFNAAFANSELRKPESRAAKAQSDCSIPAFAGKR